LEFGEKATNLAQSIYEVFLMNNVKIRDLNYKPDGYYSNSSDKMLKYIPANVTCTLEFGCACGNFSKLIKEKYGAQCWGVEIDISSAESAKSKLDKVLNLDAHEAVKHLPPNYFDCIILNDVLEHMVDPYSLLVKIKPLLKENGMLIASIPNIRFWRTFKDFVIHGNWDYTDSGILDKTHLRFFTYKSIKKIFNQLGYDLITHEGVRPTRSKSFKIVNALFLNSLRDTQYRQFAVVARIKHS
jgi:2-polyprenyl-3-methyl-5-hydroxy-6-metoxy-1,4-benzoquinol methylase